MLYFILECTLFWLATVSAANIDKVESKKAIVHKSFACSLYPSLCAEYPPYVYNPEGGHYGRETRKRVSSEKTLCDFYPSMCRDSFRSHPSSDYFPSLYNDKREMKTTNQDRELNQSTNQKRVSESANQKRGSLVSANQKRDVCRAKCREEMLCTYKCMRNTRIFLI